MSQWAHVTAIFRIDSIDNDLDISQVIGDPLEDMDYDESYEEHFLPTGSEGSLEYSLWENPDPNCLAKYTLSVFGDLRDFVNVNRIKRWFEETCVRIEFLRQAVCTIHLEHDKITTLTYSYDSRKASAVIHENNYL